MKSMILILSMGLSLFTFNLSSAFAYYDNWPPFKQGSYRYLDLRPVPDKDIPSFIEDNSDLDEGRDIKFYDIYKGNLNGHGLVDYVVLHTEPSPYLNSVDIYLKKGKGYRKVAYNSCAVDTKDFIVNKDGKPGVIISSVYWSNGHNYMAYSVYQIKECVLVNADGRFKGFPKFVFMTDKYNDHDTGRLTQRERLQQTKVKNNSIHFEDIR